MHSALQPLTLAQLDEGLRGVLKPTFERLGYVNEFFLIAGRVPAAMRAFADLTEALKKQINANINEVISLTVSTRLGCKAERIQHERLVLKQGFPREWIKELVSLEAPPAESMLSAEERCARAFALVMIDGDREKIAAGIAEVAALFGQERAVGIAMQVARCVMIAMWFNAFEINVPVASIFQDA
jgi:hypothetical protein